MSNKVKIIKTGRKCTWEEIKIGEVFAYNACWIIGCKVSETEAMFLADDDNHWRSVIGKIVKNNINDGRILDSLSVFWGAFDERPKNASICPFDNLYKLSKSTQKLFKEE